MNHQHVIKDYQHVSETRSNSSFDYQHRSAPISLTPDRYKYVGICNDWAHIENNKRREMEDKHLQESSAFFERSGILSYTQKVQRLNHFNRKVPSLCPSISQHARHELDFNRYVGQNYAYKQKYPGGSLAHEESFSREMFADTNDYSLTYFRKTWKKNPNEMSGQPHPITWTNKSRVLPGSNERSNTHYRPIWEQINQEDLCRQKLNEHMSDRNLKECESSHNPAFMTGVMDHEISNSQGWETEMKLLSDKTSNNLALPVNCIPGEPDQTVKSNKSDDKLSHDMKNISDTSNTKTKNDSKAVEQKECRYNKIAKLADILNAKIKEIRDECTNETSFSSNIVTEKDADYNTKLNVRNSKKILTDVPRESGNNIESDGTRYADNANKPVKANLSDKMEKRKSLENMENEPKAGFNHSFSTRKGYIKEKNSFVFDPANEKLQEYKIRPRKGRETKRQISDKLKELELKMIEDFEGHTVSEPSISKQKNQMIESRETEDINKVKHLKESSSMKSVHTEVSSIKGDSYNFANERPSICDKMLQSGEVKSKTLKNHKRVSFGNVSYRLIEPRPKSAVLNNKNLVLSQKIDKTTKRFVKTINEPKQMETLKVKDKLMKEAFKKSPLGSSKTANVSAEIKQKAQELFQKTMKKSERITDRKRQKKLLPLISENNKGEANLKTFKIPKIGQTNSNEHKPLTKHTVTKQVIPENKNMSNECELFEEVKEIVKAEKMKKLTNAIKPSSDFKTAEVKPAEGIVSSVAGKSQANCYAESVLCEPLKKHTEIRQLASENKNLSGGYKVVEEVRETNHDVKKKSTTVNKPSGDFRTAQVKQAGRLVSSAAAKSEADCHSDSVSRNSLKIHTETKQKVSGNKMSKGCELTDGKTKTVKAEKTKIQKNIKSSSDFKTTPDKPAVSAAADKYGSKFETESKSCEIFKNLPETKQVRFENKQLLSGCKVTKSVKAEEKMKVTNINKRSSNFKIGQASTAGGIVSSAAEECKANLYSDSLSLKPSKKHAVNKDVVTKNKKVSDDCKEAEERTKTMKAEKTKEQHRNVRKLSTDFKQTEVKTAVSSEANYEVNYDTDGISCNSLKEHTGTRQVNSYNKKLSNDCELAKDITETMKAAKTKELENDITPSSDFKTVQVKLTVGIDSEAVAKSEAKCDTDSILCSAVTEKLIEDSLSVFFHGASKRDSTSKCKNAFEYEKQKSLKACNTSKSLNTEWVGIGSTVFSNNNMIGKEVSTACKPLKVPKEKNNSAEAVNMKEKQQNLGAWSLKTWIHNKEQNNELSAKDSVKEMQSKNLPVVHNLTHKLSCMNQSTSNRNSLQQESARTNLISNDKKIFNASDKTRSLKLQWSSKEKKEANVQAKTSTTKGDKVITPSKSICGSNVHAIETNDKKPEKSYHITSVNEPKSVSLYKKVNLNLKQNSASNYRKEDSFVDKKDNRKEKQELVKIDLKDQSLPGGNSVCKTGKISSVEKSKNQTGQLQYSITSSQCYDVKKTTNENNKPRISEDAATVRLSSVSGIDKPQVHVNPVSSHKHASHMPLATHKPKYTSAVVTDQYHLGHGQPRKCNSKSFLYSMANRPDGQNNEFVPSTTTALKVQVPSLDAPSSKQSSKTLQTKVHYPLSLQQAPYQPQIASDSASMDCFSNTMPPFKHKMQTLNVFQSQNPCLGREGRASSVCDGQTYSALDCSKLSRTYSPVATAVKDDFWGDQMPLDTDKAKPNNAPSYIPFSANNIQSYKLHSDAAEGFGPAPGLAFCRPMPSYEPGMTEVNINQNHSSHMFSSHMVQGITGIDHVAVSARNTPVISQPTNKIYPGQDYLSTNLSNSWTDHSGFSRINHGFNFPVYGMIDAKNSHRVKGWDSNESCHYDGFNNQQRIGFDALYNHALQRNQFVYNYSGNESFGWDRRNMSGGYLNQMQATRPYFQTNSFANYSQTQAMMIPSGEMETFQQHNSSFDSLGAFGIGNSYTEELMTNQQHTDPHFSHTHSFRNPEFENEFARTSTLKYPQEHTQLDCYTNNFKSFNCDTTTKWTQDSGDIPNRQRASAMQDTSSTRSDDLKQKAMNYENLCQSQETSTSNTQSSNLDLDVERFLKEMESVSSSELTTLTNYILNDIANRSPPVLSPVVEKRLVSNELTDSVSHIVNETSVDRISKTVNNLIDECKHSLIEDIIEGSSFVPQRQSSNLSLESDLASTAEHCEKNVPVTDIKASYQTTKFGTDNENPNSKISSGVEGECITSSTDAQALGSGKETVKVEADCVVASNEIDKPEVAAEATNKNNNTSSYRYNSVPISESALTEDKKEEVSNTETANLDVNSEIENVKTSTFEDGRLAVAFWSPESFGTNNTASNKTCSTVAVKEIGKKVVSSENVTNNHKGDSSITSGGAERQSDTDSRADLNLEPIKVATDVENTISSKTNHDVQKEYEKDSLKQVNSMSSLKKRKPTSEHHLYDSAAVFLGTNFDQEIPRKRKRPQSLHTYLENEQSVGLRTRKHSYDNQKANKELQLKKKLKVGADKGQNKKEGNKKEEVIGVSQDCKPIKATRGCKPKEEVQQGMPSEPCVPKKRGRKRKKSKVKLAEKDHDLTNKTSVRSVSSECDGTKEKVLEENLSQKDKCAPELKVALTDIMGKKNILTKSKQKLSKKSNLGHSSHHKDKKRATSRNEIKDKNKKYCGKRKTEAVKDSQKRRKIDKLDTKSGTGTTETSLLTVVKSSVTEKELMPSTDTLPNSEKELKCSVCEVKVQPSELWTHLKIAHPRHCDVCYLKFPSKTARRQHKIEHAEEVFECVQCSKKFLKPWFLKAHVKHCKKKGHDASEQVGGKPSFNETEQAVAALCGIANLQNDEEQNMSAPLCTTNHPGDLTDTSSNIPVNAEIQNQTGSLTFDQDYNIVWGNSQATVKQTDGNAFVIEIERDGDLNTLGQSEAGDCVTDQIRYDTDVEVGNLGSVDGISVMLNESEVSLNPDPVVSYITTGTSEALLKADSLISDVNTRTYTCGLSILADLCERETASRQREQQGAPSGSIETKDVLIAGQGALSPVVNDSISLNDYELGMERDLMLETDNLCGIASTFSRAFFNDRSAV